MSLCDESISKLLEFRGLVKGQQSATQYDPDSRASEKKGVVCLGG
jgi:hypothetical protein